MIYTREGEIKPVNSLHFGKHFFRKETNSREIEIVKLLQTHPHPNIVTFYTISPKQYYIDMEFLDTHVEIPKEKLIETMKGVKDHLQSLGILYIDWKPDQMGISEDGTIKLYDFDMSALIDPNTKAWIIHPTDIAFAYRQAEEAGLKDPREIDNYTFTLMYPPEDFKEAL
jgi:serine/threonine protein kinase